VGVEACDLIAVLEDLDGASSGSHNRLLSSPDSINDGTVCLKTVKDLLLRERENANNSLGCLDERGVTS
jgi:hypothetical protein